MYVLLSHVYRLLYLKIRIWWGRGGSADRIKSVTVSYFDTGNSSATKKKSSLVQKDALQRSKTRLVNFRLLSPLVCRNFFTQVFESFSFSRPTEMQIHLVLWNFNSHAHVFSRFSASQVMSHPPVCLFELYHFVSPMSETTFLYILSFTPILH